MSKHNIILQILSIMNVLGFFFLWAETVNSIMRRSVRGLGLDARCASGGVHTLLYTDGAANLCQSGRAPVTNREV